MIKQIVIIFFLTLSFSNYIQAQIDSLKNTWNPLKDSTPKGTSIMELGKGAIINKFIDSLNNFENELPQFLDDLYIDFKYYDAYLRYGSLISTRYYIIEKVENFSSLLAILKSDNPNFKIKPNKLIVDDKYKNLINKIPYLNHSLHELVQIKINSIKKD